MMITVAGDIASGKSTLSRKICSMYGFSYVPARRSELPFLEDFLEDADQHFFAMQAAYLLSKAGEIEEELRHRNSLVVDRSLNEDINIFARYWMDARAIDARERDVYDRLADYVLRHTPRPDVFIYCKCDPALRGERITERMRKAFELKYPLNYVEALSERYADFGYPRCPAIVELDSGILDFRQEETITHIMDEIANYLDYKKSNHQTSLFGNCEKPPETSYIKVVE